MILKLPENRKEIIGYLNSVDEDTFIDEFVIPFFNSQGYQVYRINQHGPGEHGKDIIFCRYVPFFFESEFIAVQAKAEKVTSSNVQKFSSQLMRALQTKFAPRSGKGDLIPHYAIFINARSHANEAYTEFPQLASSPHIKILSQENVCELILQYGIGPIHLMKKLSRTTTEAPSIEDQEVLKTILNGNPAEIDKLLDHDLKFLKKKLSISTKEVIVDYIYDRWQKDRSWQGTVKPMKWLDTYFDFMVENQYEYLLDVFDEFNSSTPSFNASGYTSSIVAKITPEILFSIAKPFIHHCAKVVVSRSIANKQIVIKKLGELLNSELIAESGLRIWMKKIYDFYEGNIEEQEYEVIENEIYDFAYPDIAKLKRKRRKKSEPNQ